MMSRPLERVFALILALGVTAGIAALSRVPYAPEHGAEALLRLSWRARGERVQECRRPTEEELRGLPPHMRRREICEGRISPYELRVTIDTELALIDTIHGSGAREDRPLYVFREIPLSPGPHRFGVAFRRLGPDPGGTVDERAVPPRMRLDVSARLEPREVMLITYNPEARDLIARRPPGSGEG